MRNLASGGAIFALFRETAERGPKYFDKEWVRDGAIAIQQRTPWRAAVSARVGASCLGSVPSVGRRAPSSLSRIGNFGPRLLSCMDWEYQWGVSECGQQVCGWEWRRLGWRLG